MLAKTDSSFKFRIEVDHGRSQFFFGFFGAQDAQRKGCFTFDGTFGNRLTIRKPHSLNRLIFAFKRLEESWYCGWSYFNESLSCFKVKLTPGSSW